MSSVSNVSQVQELSPYTQGGRIDPYAIFKLNFQALGGEKNVKQDTTFRFKGELTIDDTTFQYQEAIKKPLKGIKVIFSNYRALYKGGDDGRFMWAEQNGKVSTVEEYETPNREIQKLWDEYAYTDPKNRVFNVSATRKTIVDGSTCFEVVIKNRKTDEVVTHYYDTSSFLLKREIRKSENEHTQIDFSDYKAVGNIKMAFKKDTLFLDSGNKQSIKWEKIERGIYLADSIFSPPEEKIRPSDLSAMTGTGAKVDTYA